MKQYFIGGVFSLIILFWIFGSTSSVEVYSGENDSTSTQIVSTSTAGTSSVVIETEKRATHLLTPNSVRAIYISSWVASTPSVREKLIAMVDETELNAVVVDVKDG